MASYDSFRFQKLANCLTEVEKDVNDIDNEEYEYVVAVDNLDSLLDDRPIGPPATASTSNLGISSNMPPLGSMPMYNPPNQTNMYMAPPQNFTPHQPYGANLGLMQTPASMMNAPVPLYQPNQQ